MVWGGWEGHEPKPCVDGSRRSCGTRGSTSKSRTHSMSTSTRTGWRFDLIVPVWTMGTITKEQEARAAGGGQGGVERRPAGMAAWPTRSATTPSTSSWSAASGWPTPATSSTTGQHRPPATTRSPPGSTTSRCTRSSTTSTSIRRTRCWRPPPSRGEHAPWIAGTVMPVVWKRR